MVDLVEPSRDVTLRPDGPGTAQPWLGVRLDVDVDWDELAAIVEDAYRLVAPKKLVAQLDG